MSDYFTFESAERLETGATARSAALNALFDELNTGLAKLPTEAELKGGTINYVATDSGAANAYVVSLPYAPAAYVDGQEVIFKAGAANTGASTINVNSLGVKSITRFGGAALVARDIAAAKIYTLRYNSTVGKFEIVSPVTNEKIFHGRVSAYYILFTTRLPTGWTTTQTATYTHRVTHNLGTANYTVVATSYAGFAEIVGVTSTTFTVTISTTTLGWYFFLALDQA